MENEYKSLTAYIKQKNNRIFKDNLLRLMLVEIKLKSGQIDEYMLLPTTYKSGVYCGRCWYEGYNHIINILSEKILQQVKQLVSKGSQMNFYNYLEIQKWITEKTGLTDFPEMPESPKLQTKDNN
jgi:hypothetical protein